MSVGCAVVDEYFVYDRLFGLVSGVSVGLKCQDF